MLYSSFYLRHVSQLTTSHMKHDLGRTHWPSFFFFLSPLSWLRPTGPHLLAASPSPRRTLGRVDARNLKAAREVAFGNLTEDPSRPPIRDPRSIQFDRAGENRAYSPTYVRGRCLATHHSVMMISRERRPCARVDHQWWGGLVFTGYILYYLGPRRKTGELAREARADT